jgi:hypothetical protein
MEIAVATPPRYEPDAALVRAAQVAGRERAGRIQINHDPRLAVQGAHAVYTDVWVSMGRDDEQAERVPALERYRVDARLMSLAAADAVFLHHRALGHGTLLTGPRARTRAGFPQKQGGRDPMTHRHALATIKSPDLVPTAGASNDQANRRRPRHSS